MRPGNAGPWEWEGGERENAFANQARAFVAAVRAGDPGRVKSPYGGALNSLAAVLGANVSAERGARFWIWVNLPLEKGCYGIS